MLHDFTILIMKHNANLLAFANFERLGFGITHALENKIRPLGIGTADCPTIGVWNHMNTLPVGVLTVAESLCPFFLPEQSLSE